MKIEIVIDTVIKMFIINLFVFILFFKISNQKCNYLKIFVGSVMLSVIYVIEKNYINDDIFVLIISTYLMQNVFLWIILSNKNCIIVGNFISNTVVYILYSLSLIIEIAIKMIFSIEFDIRNQTIDLILALAIEAIFLKCIMNLKRIKNGLSFLKDQVENE